MTGLKCALRDKQSDCNECSRVLAVKNLPRYLPAPTNTRFGVLGSESHYAEFPHAFEPAPLFKSRFNNGNFLFQ